MARPRKFDEAEVISAARDEFWSRGYAATSVDDLSAATGLGKGSLYAAFGDKHGLFLRALEGYCTDMIGTFRIELAAPDLGGYDRLVHHIRSQAKLFANDKPRRGCLMAKSAAELAGTDDEVAGIIDRSLAEWRSALVACVQVAQAEGAIGPGVRPQALASAVLAFVRGLEALDKGGVRPAQIKAAAEAFIDMIPRA
ncbi:TetR/AcrR family transcriptional regulator [Mycolicibacterium setense]|uniref:TetR/AcrR family transcriptional regulator n=1 Tax=Mycolicibacterium setense TaxID=431269 RepID=UPI000575E0AF|nr:TetR/AcrR family transcriptional regulator [Mycolicibacterium setense]KHO17524.1 TetR family transcriptional regulator [Mycolicibacterium setense]MCV7109577.1 TetR/AcrR family transcriptional regulator [Mycolicibacterium setense]OBB14275.1 TetR family transcriptional regulator [Mycolicibacterium setense]